MSQPQQYAPSMSWSVWLAGWLMISGIPLPWSAADYTPSPDKNILFIAVDDLRPQFTARGMNLHGVDRMVTPALDTLSRDGMLFTRSYCNIPVCGASRISLMTSQRPYKTPGASNGRCWSFDDSVHDAINAPAWPSMPAHFKSQGFVTASFGKLYHVNTDDSAHWMTRVYPTATITTNAVAVGLKAEAEYVDYKIADLAIAEIEARRTNRFFCAVGFIKPHLPFEIPQAYWDLYTNAPITRPYNNFKPTNAPNASIHNFPELRGYSDIPDTGAMTDAKCKELIRGYYASVSFMDAQLGRVIEKLKTTLDGNGVPLYDKTVIVLWGDHGWNLEEHTLWTKHNNYQTALQAPLMVRDPDIAEGNRRCNRLVEFVDIYPTLCELVGVPWPSPNLEGTSFVPLLLNPEREWKQAVFSRYILGDSITTERYSYSEYVTGADTANGAMLYDLSVDPDENWNIAPNNPELVAALRAYLGGGTAAGKRYAWQAMVDRDNKNRPITVSIKALELPAPIYPAGYPRARPPAKAPVIEAEIRRAGASQLAVDLRGTSDNPFERASVRYSLDGSTPGPDAPLYHAPLLFDGTVSTTLHARAVGATGLTGAVSRIELEDLSAAP